VPENFRLFVACSNGPAQAALESSVCRAAQSGGCSFIVKLSTASPVLEMKSGGPYAAHLEVERLLSELQVPHAVLRPNLFLDEISFGGFLGVCGTLHAADVCAHPFAASPIAAVDVRDVGACAAALLIAEDPDAGAGGGGGRYYEINGPSAICLGAELADAISELRQRPVAIEPCTVEEYLTERGLEGAAAASLTGFLSVLQTQCAATDDTVLRLTGSPPRSVRQFVHDYATRFLPTT